MNGLIERAYAAVTTSIPTVTPASSSIGSVGDLFGVIATWVIYIAGALAFIYLIYSGILYITAAGNPDQAKKGQQGIINAVIGIIIITLAYVIVTVVQNAAKTGNINGS